MFWFIYRMNAEHLKSEQKTVRWMRQKQHTESSVYRIISTDELWETYWRMPIANEIFHDVDIELFVSIKACIIGLHRLHVDG